jgi:hypothetical protein
MTPIFLNMVRRSGWRKIQPGSSSAGDAVTKSQNADLF